MANVLKPDKKPPRRSRETTPSNFTPYSYGGIGAVPRRSIPDNFFGNTANKLETMYNKSPLTLLALLPDIHPTVSHALFTAQRLMWSDDVKVVALKASGKQDQNGTKHIKDLFDNLPQEMGGLSGLLHQFTASVFTTGMCCVECVPNKDLLTGLGGIYPVDSNTIVFRRVDGNYDSDLTPFQQQIFFKMNQAKTKDFFGFGQTQLNPELFFWQSIDSTVDDPYGRPPYGTALNEALSDIALMQDLRDAVHNTAFPRLQIGLNRESLHRQAVEILRITDPIEAAKYVNDVFQSVSDYLENLYADDNIVCDSDGVLNVVTPGDFSGLSEILSFLRQRLAQSLKTLPTLLGINDGSTFNYTSVEWTIYAQGLETIRQIIGKIIERIANLHLRLLGSSSKALVVYKPIKTNDELIDANTQNVQIMNTQNKRNEGWISDDEASTEITGHLPTGTKVEMPIQGGTTEQMGKPGTKNIPQNPNSEGTTRH